MTRLFGITDRQIAKLVTLVMMLSDKNDPVEIMLRDKIFTVLNDVAKNEIGAPSEEIIINEVVDL